MKPIEVESRNQHGLSIQKVGHRLASPAIPIYERIKPTVQCIHADCTWTNGWLPQKHCHVVFHVCRSNRRIFLVPTTLFHYIPVPQIAIPSCFLEEEWPSLQRANTPPLPKGPRTQSPLPPSRPRRTRSPNKECNTLWPLFGPNTRPAYRAHQSHRPSPAAPENTVTPSSFPSPANTQQQHQACLQLQGPLSSPTRANEQHQTPCLPRGRDKDSRSRQRGLTRHSPRLPPRPRQTRSTNTRPASPTPAMIPHPRPRTPTVCPLHTGAHVLVQPHLLLWSPGTLTAFQHMGG